MQASRRPQRTRKRIAIVLHEDSFYIRSVLRGVASYARPARPWRLERVPPEDFQRGGKAPARCDGVITHIHHPSVVHELEPLACPVIGVSSLIEDDPFPAVTADDMAVGRLACGHLRDHGHRHLAFVGLRDLVFARQRRLGFLRAAEEAGLDVAAHDIALRWLLRSPSSDSKPVRAFIDWLRALPVPTGLFACNDAAAWFVSELCRQAEIEVPLEIAILGVDNDDLLCRLAYPPLSSVIVPGERIGYLAAEQLDLAMTDGRAPAGARLPPVGVATRQSSQFYAVDDPEVAAALTHIRDHAADGLTVAELLQAVPMSRRSLERRFHAVLGRTPLDEIHRVRVEAARQMLAQTTLPIDEVARRCGFGRANYMSRLLVRFTGRTPREVRRGLWDAEA